MAEGELENQQQRKEAVWASGVSEGCNSGHGLLKNGLKDMAPAEVLLQSSVAVKGVQKKGGEATGRVCDDHGKSKEVPVTDTDTEKQNVFSDKQVQDVKALLKALTLLSRNLPLPDPLLTAVTSISRTSAAPLGGNEKIIVGDAQKFQEDEVPTVGSDDDPIYSETRVVRPPASREPMPEGRVEFKDEDIKAHHEEHEVAAGSKDTAVSDTDTETGAWRHGKLLEEFEDAVDLQRSRLKCASALKAEKDRRVHSQLAYRIQELEGLLPETEDDVRDQCLLELHTLKLLGLQMRVRSEVAAELHLQQICGSPDAMLFDWGLMRLRRNMSALSGQDASLIPGVSSSETDERLRRKRKAERQRRIEEEEKLRITTRKRKFFNEMLNLVREFQLNGQAAAKRRKQRNDGVQAWHTKQRQRVSRAERMRFQALKADDQEAYMRMVEESKNERLTTLLSKTDDLLQKLGAMVQRQKDADPEVPLKKEKPQKAKDTGREPTDAASPRLKGKDSERDTEEVASPSFRDKTTVKEGSSPEEDNDSLLELHPDGTGAKRDLMEGQRQYNSAVHSIEEKVTEQPSMLEGGTLRSYQIEGLQWMLSLYNNNLNGILADEMGLGKTIQTIALLAYLMENKNLNGPHLIIAPKAVLPNWKHEFATWAPSIVAVLYDGRIEDRKAMREEYGDEGKFNVLVTHYDLIMRDKAFLKKIHWHYMIVDEGHRLKNHDCMLSRTLVTGYHIRRRLLLTGTPIQNSLSELWSLLNFLLPAIFNSSQNFEEWFNAPFADRSEVSLSDEEQLLVIRRLHQVIRPFLLRRKKAEVEKYLPGKTQVILKCDLSSWQRLYYQQIIDSGRVGLDSGSGKSRGLQNTAMQLRKCCNHPFLFLEGGDYTSRLGNLIVRSSGKFELLDRLLPKLREGGHRVLLFSQMTRLMDILEDYLDWHGYKYLRLDGTTKTEERGVLLQKFNAPDSPYFMFLLSTRAGGLGLNLQTADTVIIFDSDWNPQMDQQAEDRAHRIGQKKEVRVFVLVSVGSIEEEILERAKSKMGIDAKVIQAGLFNTTSTAQERREMLEEIMRRGADALGTDVPSEREINRLAARNDEEYKMFEEMDEVRRKEEGYITRLIEEHEVPDWVFLGAEHSKVAQAEEAARAAADTSMPGKRKRKEVLYADVLSDSEWMKAIEKGEDVMEAVKSQRVKRLKKKEAEVNGSDGAGAEDGGQTDADDNCEVTVEADSDDEAIGGKNTFRGMKGKERNAKRSSGAHAEATATPEKEISVSRTLQVNSDNWKGLKRKRSRPKEDENFHENSRKVKSDADDGIDDGSPVL
ncbi:protein Mpsnf1.24 [Marchantia polymorpha subsp. ruderalis]